MSRLVSIVLFFVLVFFSSCVSSPDDGISEGDLILQGIIGGELVLIDLERDDIPAVIKDLLEFMELRETNLRLKSLLFELTETRIEIGDFGNELEKDVFEFQQGARTHLSN